jgi:hypothetical protein
MPDPNSKDTCAARRRGRRYRLAGISVLLLGLISAGVVYWLGSRAPDYSDDPDMVGFNRSEERQMGILFGKQGRMMEDLTHSLKQPGTQALLIVAAAGVIAAGCFYSARILEAEAAPAAATSPPQS